LTSEAEQEDDEGDWTRLDARGTGKTLDTPAFPSWTDEQLQEFQSSYEAINMQSETVDKTYMPMTWGFDKHKSYDNFCLGSD
jgi:chitinase